MALTYLLRSSPSLKSRFFKFGCQSDMVFLNRFIQCKTNLILDSKVNMSTKNQDFEDRANWIVMADDGRTVVCWHPEQHFPYEHTKPIPRMEADPNEENAVLKFQYRIRERYPFRKEFDEENQCFDPMVMEELQKLTSTTKHQWYPRRGIRKRKPNPPVDRKGL